MKIVWIILVTLAVALAVFLIVTYNNLVRLRQRLKNAWSQLSLIHI